MTTVLQFIRVFVWILLLSLVATWFKTFVEGHYWEHAPIYLTFLFGAFPFWGSWLAWKASQALSTQIKLEKNN
jgi:ABC-type transport system involved in cytochrome bd biosynthesis fused ATPase/permease subunit